MCFYNNFYYCYIFRNTYMCHFLVEVVVKYGKMYITSSGDSYANEY